MPATLEERVAYLEGKVEEHSSVWIDLRERLIHMEQKFDQRFIQIDQRFMQIDQRINETNQRIDKIFFLIIATLATSIGSLIGIVASIVTR